MPATPSKESPGELRVLHVCAGNLFGGVERMLLTLAEERGCCPAMIPSFAVSYEGEASRRLRAAGVEVANIGPTRFIKPWTIWATRGRVKRLCQQNQIDIVVAHGCWAHAVLGRSDSRQGLFVHDVLRGRHWLERRSLRVPAALVIANSHYTLGELPSGAFPQARRAVVHCPSAPREVEVSTPAKLRLRESMQTGGESVVIVLSARWEPYKGHFLLVDALGRVRTRTPWNLWFAGGTQRPHEEAYQAQVLALTKRLGIADRVRLLGQRSDVPEVLAAADIHCQPNLSPEPFGLTFVEALAAGLTVVTTRHGGGEEILSPDFGLLSPPGDAAALAELLTAAIESPQLRAELAAKGPRRARELCDPARQLARLHEVLRSAL